jgi:hypothetical protein
MFMTVCMSGSGNEWASITDTNQKRTPFSSRPLSDSPNSTMENGPPLDLHEIATLINYEHASTEPRFRHMKFWDYNVFPTENLVLYGIPDARAVLDRTGKVPTLRFSFR